MATTEKRVLAELLAQIEDEWEALPQIKPGRCYYVATRLIDEGIVSRAGQA